MRYAERRTERTDGLDVGHEKEGEFEDDYKEKMQFGETTMSLVLDMLNLTWF